MRADDNVGAMVPDSVVPDFLVRRRRLGPDEGRGAEVEGEMDVLEGRSEAADVTVTDADMGLRREDVGATLAYDGLVCA